MRSAILMLGVLALAACQLTAPATVPPAPVTVPAPIVGDVVAAKAMMPAEDAVVTDLETPPVEVAPQDVAPEVAKSPEQIRCEKDGGSWSRVGESSARACVDRTRDAGKQCRRDRDCDGVCLARSGTCAPVTPLFGCNEVLQDDGRRMTLCLD